MGSSGATHGSGRCFILKQLDTRVLSSADHCRGSAGGTARGWNAFSDQVGLRLGLNVES